MFISVETGITDLVVLTFPQYAQSDTPTDRQPEVSIVIDVPESFGNKND